MRLIGQGFHLLNRLCARAMDRYFSWTLESHLAGKAKQFGSVNVAGKARFANVEGLTIGHNVHINVDAYWVCDGGLSIGDNCHFGKGTTIYARNHNHKGKAVPYDDTNIARPVTIRANVWVGANVTILPGTEIGEGAIIGAGAVVHGKIEPLAIVGAAAPVTIGSRDETHYHAKVAAGHYDDASDKLVVKK